MPELADKLEAANKRRAAAKHDLNVTAFNRASGEIIDLLEKVDEVVRKLGREREYEQAYRTPPPIDNIVAFLRSVL